MSDDIPVPNDIVAAISESMEGRTIVAKSKHVIEDSTITTFNDLKKGLKEGRVPGNAIIEWSDESGNLRVNVIDFLMEENVKATDPNSGERIVVKTSDIPDGSWRLLY